MTALASYSHLEGWTPVGYGKAPEHFLVWADLRKHVFDKSFFDRTLNIWRLEEDQRTIATGFDALEALDSQPSLDPDLIIAHPSRSGSTLLARLAAFEDNTILVSEPGLLSDLLRHNLRDGFDQPVENILRQAVRALGRIRFGNERRYVLKLSSQMTRYLPEFRKAFPQTPIVWLQRQPAEIIESNLTKPARASRPIPLHERAQWAVRRVTLAFMGATAFTDDRTHIVDYRELPDAAWTKVAGLMGTKTTSDGLARMRDIARVHAHDGKPYVPRPRQPLSEEMQAIVHGTLDPMYNALALRRRSN